MKSEKAVGPDDIPVEVWKCLGEAAVEFLASLFNRVLESERMPEEWRRSVLVPIFKNKGDVQSCSNYRGIKLMSHTMKLWERVVEARLRKVVEICEQQYGFMPRKSTTDAIFALRILMEKYRDGQRELHCVFVDLEKAYDRVPREELWYCMRKSGIAEKYVTVVQDMYERSRTMVRCAVGQREEFKVEVGLHQGSALSPFLFAIVMDQLSEEVRQESPWTMMFADDIVICSESREQVEENLERWRFALERRGMKVSRSKTKYMCVNEMEGSGTVRLQGEEVKKVQEFKYLGSTVQSNGECGKEVKKRVQAGWNGWRKVSGVLCDRKISARIKGKVYRTVVRPAMLYGLETVSLRKRQESELEVAELKMLREDHRDYLRFLWYRNNDLDSEIVDHRMRVHVFENSQSPAVTIYGLQRAAKEYEESFGSDTRKLVHKEFYVDDMLKLCATEAEAIDLLKCTQDMLAVSNFRLQKIISNCLSMIEAFPSEDCADGIKDLQLFSNGLTILHSLGLSWNVATDSFMIHVSDDDKPFTRSLFPLGFLAPLTMQGKLLLRELTKQGESWDSPLPEDMEAE
ncbi:hypothetical protein QTP70_002155 [Hemibagrus guttatus]|uniref:ribonuclease H n=1 Tax=Hemibagrus guttatus TaxID=175788 RepID=A0AAE0PR04_9TELE|nr:hypothetical protein QTP70_002155 [Hemibagrus guttatus]